MGRKMYSLGIAVIVTKRASRVASREPSPQEINRPRDRCIEPLHTAGRRESKLQMNKATTSAPPFSLALITQ
jgi:uncharacterized protein YraI